MTRSPWVSAGSDYPVDRLRIPDHPQPQHAPQCVVYSIWMVTQYVANEYSVREIRSETNTIKIDDILEYIEIGSFGWENPRQSPLTEISEHIRTVKFNLNYWYGSPPRSLQTISKACLENDLPVIAFIDRVLLEEGVRNEGALHSILITGAGGEHTIINDPLVEGTKIVENDKLEDAWDPEYNQVVETKIADRFKPEKA